MVCQHVRTSALVCPTALAPHGATPYKTTDAFSCAFVSDSSCIAAQEPRSQRRLGRYKSSYVLLPGVVSLTPFAMAKPLLPRLAQASRAIAGPYSTARRTLSALQTCDSSPLSLFLSTLLLSSEFTLVSDPLDVRMLPTAVVLAVLVAIPLTALRWAAVGRRADATRLATAWGWLVGPFLPASNLFFYVGFVVAERYVMIAEDLLMDSYLLS